METFDLYEDIEKRTNGEIYLGVVGPVRTGKSTFIKKFMDLFVLPSIEDEYILKKTQDELPQSSAGTTIMTTEPKFIPNESLSIKALGDVNFKVKLIDCVGYLVDGATGHIEDGMERMVNTPWNKEPIPFKEAAEVGTEKVITDHSTLGIVVTTDGSISGLSRESYRAAEEKAISKLKEINKPFAILLNTLYPESPESESLALEMEEMYGVSVIPINALKLSKDDINKIFEVMLYEFPLSEIEIDMPKWVYSLSADNPLKKSLVDTMISKMQDIETVADIYKFANLVEDNGNIKNTKIKNVDLGKGKADIDVELNDDLFYDVISESSGLVIKDEYELINAIMELAKMKEKYDKVANALDEVEQKGYGVVIPKIDELSIDDPEIIKQGSRYGVKLKAKAPSIHLIKADIEAEVSPIVGTEQQSRDLLDYLKSEANTNPSGMWQSNIFGKSLCELVSDDLQSKLNKMSVTSQERLQETLQRVINEGSGNLICIII